MGRDPIDPKPRILIVEDEAIIAFDLKNTLNNFGYTVVDVKRSAAQGIEACRDDPPDLVLMDIVLQGPLDGIEAAEQIRSRWGIPVVFLTAYADQERLKRARLVYPFGYLLKPVKEQDLKVTLEMALYVSQVDAERKKAEAVLQQSEDKFRLAFQTSPDSININRLEDGLYIDINQGFTDLTGFTREDVIGRTSLEKNIWHDPADRKRLVQGLRERGIYENLEAQFRRKDGSLTTALMSARVLRLEGVPHILSITRDISERQRAEAEKAKLEAQLQQAQKLESVGRLAGGVAHDFNNMLGAILGHAELAMTLLEPTDPTRAHLEEIQKAAQRSADLTRQLLAFARQQTIAPKVLNLNETIEGMLKMLRRLIGEDLNLAWLPGERVWPIKMDPSQIDQILANLCVNARDAITDVGQVTIETSNSTFDLAYCADHPGFVPGDYVRLTVSDDGCGMDRETRAHIFEPFFTTKGVGEGTGLGLAMVYGVVKQNKGFIYVYSEPGQGTTLAIYLPRHAGKTEPIQEAVPLGPTRRGQETILLVEDEPTMLKLTRQMLERQGYIVREAGTPGEAMGLAQEHAGEVHLLMTDVVMPEMNGRDLAKNLLSLYPNLKRLFMSGYTANVIAHHGILDPGVHFIQKPFSMKELADKVREALDD